MAGNAAKESMLPLATSAATTQTEGDAPKKGRLYDFLTLEKLLSKKTLEKFRWSNIPDMAKLGIYFGVYLSIGTTVFYSLEDQIKGKKTNDLVDSLYLCVVTMTTVGYGDLVPNGFSSKILATAFATVGMCLVGIVVKIAASFLVEKQEKMLMNALHLANKIGPVDALKQIESTKISYWKLIISAGVMFGHFLIGIFMLIGIEGMDTMDAVYCSLTTMTTVGYGDESFSTSFGRLFGIFWISTGTSTLGQLLLYFAEVYTEAQQKEVVKMVLSKRITDMDMEAAEHVDDEKKRLGTADYLKISEDDMNLAAKEFQDAKP